MPRKIYLDMCCLKRPYDDQDNPRVAVETEAVLAVVAAVKEGLAVSVRSLAHDQENSRDTNRKRAGAVQAWLEGLNPVEPISVAVADRARALEAVGFPGMDAYHLAWAEAMGASVFLTTDDALVARSKRAGGIMKIRVLNPVDYFSELTR